MKLKLHLSVHFRIGPFDFGKIDKVFALPAFAAVLFNGHGILLETVAADEPGSATVTKVNHNDPVKSEHEEG